MLAKTVPCFAQGVTAQRSSSGVTRLYSEPFKRRHIHKYIARVARLPERMELELDELGSWVIERCDGRSVAELSVELAAYLRLTRREAEVALGDFLRQLIARHLIDLHTLDSSAGQRA